MSYLIDTCAISELAKPKPDNGLVGWIEAIDEHALQVSVVTLGELWKGITKLAAGRRKEALLAWIGDDLPRRFGGRVLPVSQDVACEWGRISGEAEGRGRAIPVLDAFIAATAKVHGLIVVTRNTGDFEKTGARVLNPWKR